MRKIISQRHALIVLRVMVGIIMMAHGFQRLYYGTVGEFGGWLNSQGFIIGTTIAWLITLFELIGGATLVAGFFKKWISLAWMLVIIPGIFMVHLQHGWYVVGPSTGGVEYSLLILASLVVLISDDH
jgi:putative oxidoreductase